LPSSCRRRASRGGEELARGVASIDRSFKTPSLMPLDTPAMKASARWSPMKDEFDR
jgi:hypothetical protein